MKRFTAREILGWGIIVLVGISALGSWNVFFETVLRPDLWNTISSLLWFSLLGSVFFLGTVVWHERTSQYAGAILVFLPSALFVHTWYHLALVLLSSLLVFSSSRSIQKEIKDRVRFRFFRNVRSGAFLFIFGLSLALSSAYFASIERESWEELVPRFSVGEGTATALFKTVAYLYPPWKNLADKEMTVDGFLVSLQEEKTVPEQALSENMQQPLGSTATSLALFEYLKRGAERKGIPMEALSEELGLRAGREQIALLVGRSVKGDEKIADVFSLAIQHKIITALSGGQASRHLSPIIVPVILAALLFLTLIPIGSAVAVVWIFLSFLLFRGVLWCGWLRLERVEQEQEILLP